jgi:spermidine/putrescine transport system permease protein
VLLVCLVLPFWVSYLMRMLAWVNLLNPDGGWASRALNTLHAPQLFELLGLGDGSEVWFGQPVTVVLGLVYGYIPFFILPLYASLDRLDGRLLDAARDLGASGRSTFLRVTLPLSVPGILAAAVITALPMFGDYYTNTILSGSPRTEMIGNQIEAYTRTTEPQRGAVLVLILSGLLLVLMAYYLVLTMRATREAREARA